MWNFISMSFTFFFHIFWRLLFSIHSIPTPSFKSHYLSVSR